MIQLTDAAKQHVRKLIADQKPDVFLRVGVKGGGCSGFSYDVKFDNQMGENDRAFDVDGLKVVSDIKSLLYLGGMHVDYSSDLLSGGFKFVNPNATGTCGCGTSFTVSSSATGASADSSTNKNNQGNGEHEIHH